MNLKTYPRWMKPYRKRVHTTRFHLYEVLEQAKLIYDGKNTTVVCLWKGIGQRQRELSVMMCNILCFDRGLGCTHAWIYQNEANVHLKSCILLYVNLILKTINIRWMNLKKIMLSQRSPTQKSHVVITFIWNIHTRQIHRDRKKTGGCLGLG